MARLEAENEVAEEIYCTPTHYAPSAMAGSCNCGAAFTRARAWGFGPAMPEDLGLRLRSDPPRLKLGRLSPNRLRVVSRAAGVNASPRGVFCERTAAGFAKQMYAATRRFRDTIEAERFSDPRIYPARRLRESGPSRPGVINHLLSSAMARTMVRQVAITDKDSRGCPGKDHRGSRTGKYHLGTRRVRKVRH